MISLHDAAQLYARQGWRVFPCKRGKAPYTINELKNASTDHAVIDKWWSRWPDANIELVTGEHFDVLDVDGEEGTQAFKAEADAHGIDLANIPRVITGRGGRHLYLAPTGNGNRVNLLPHVDWRGVGGYVIAPPSVHENGNTYTWKVKPNGAWSQAPAWLLERVNKRERATGVLLPADGSNATRYVEAALTGELGKLAMQTEPGRNDALNKAAFSLGQWVPHALDINVVRAHLERIATQIGLVEDDGLKRVHDTIESGLSAGMLDPREIPESKPPMRERPGRGARRGKVDEERRVESFAASTVERERLQWLWPGYIALGKEGMLVGDADQGKSTITCDLAARVTRGDLMPDKSPGTQRSVRRGDARVGGWLRRHGATSP